MADYESVAIYRGLYFWKKYKDFIQLNAVENRTKPSVCKPCFDNGFYVKDENMTQEPKQNFYTT